ncbi:MAG: hypothetical protein U5L04_08920 [Trueperaceae bacterium]|nr:hypothetical protein [Trueperaceae bacterium]
MLTLVLGLASTALAQDALLESYRLAVQSLQNSVRALPIDNVQSLDSLDRAANALIPLSRENGSNQLVDGIESTFDRAREAIANRSQTNLAVQVSVIVGGFQRLVYESALREANNGNLNVARQRLEQIADDMGMTEASVAEILSAQSLDALRGAFELGAARAIQGRLESARAATTTSSGQAYQALAEAYSIYIPVQDSPRLADEVGNSLISAINALVGNDDAALSAQLDILTDQMDAFATRAENLRSQGGSQSEVPEPGTPPETPPAVAEADAVPAPSQPDAVAPPEIEDDPEPADADLVESPAPAPAPPEQPAPSQPESTSENTGDASTAATPQTASREQAIAAIQQTLSQNSSLSGSSTRSLAASYYDNGFESPADVIDTLYVLGARSIVAVEIGAQQRAKDLVREFEGNYVDYLQPLVTSRDVGFNTSTLRLLDTLERAPALRLQDTVVLAGHVDATAAVLGGDRPSATHSAIVATNIFWVGITRVIVMVALFLLAFVPIYLLFLAFGGGNRNWIWVGTSLFLLLLPVMYEGLSFLLSFLGSVFGVAALDTLAKFSIFQNTISQVIWVLITAVAIGFATAGLYGICVQFGLLGGRSSAESTPTRASETQVGAGTRDTGPISWEDEF